MPFNVYAQILPIVPYCLSKSIFVFVVFFLGGGLFFVFQCKETGFV